MAGMLTTVTAGTGGLVAAVALVGLGLSVGAGQAPESASIGLLVAGLVALGIGFMLNFEHQSRLWADQMDAQLQTRRQDLQLLRAIPDLSPQMTSSTR